MCKIAYIFWDLENANIPKYFEAGDVLHALSMFLNSFGFEGDMIVEAIIAKKDDEDRCPSHVIKTLEDMGVVVSECERVVPQAADLQIQKRVEELTIKQEKAFVLVLAGDGGYVPSLRKAETDENLVMFVCYPYGKMGDDLKTKFRPFGIICFEDLMWNYATVQSRYKSLEDARKIVNVNKEVNKEEK